MNPSPHIEERERLSQYQQISTFIHHILAVAQAGGMEERRAQRLYSEIMDAYCGLQGAAFWSFRDELIRVLVTPDSHFSENGAPPPDRKAPGQN